MNSQIVYLDVRSLVAHPNNPRKDLGDLTELAESIRQKGVMQNLTVVPNLDCLGSAIPYYTIVIGHRRAAAAKLAGLETVPCVISEMSDREQLETMLLENMQRSDLTVLEQARGFQMMLDFGSSIEDVAQRTGFSASTVRRRVKLMELDQKHLERAVARGGSLMDYLELDRIADPALRDDVLCSIGTDNFKAKLTNALREEQQRACLVAWEAIISTFAQKIEKRDYVGDQYFSMDYHRNYYSWDGKDKKVEIPDDVGSAKYFYIVSSNQIDVYREHAEKTDPAAEAKKIADDEFQKAVKHVREITKGHYQLRLDFIRDFKNTKPHTAEIAQLVAIALMENEYCYNKFVNAEVIKQVIGLDIGDRRTVTQLYAVVAESEIFTQKPERALLAIAFALLDKQESYWETKWDPNQQRNHIYYSKNEKLDILYSFLLNMGYQMSDEEHEMMSGMHEFLCMNPDDSDDSDDDNLENDDDEEDEEDA